MEIITTDNCTFTLNLSNPRHRRILYTAYKLITNGRVAYLAVYHKDPIVRKKNEKRIFKYGNKIKRINKNCIV